MDEAKQDAIAEAINSAEYTFCTQYGPDQPDGVIVAYDIQCRNSAIPILDSMVFYFKSDTVLAVSFFDKHENILASTPDIDVSRIDLVATVPKIIETLFIDFSNCMLEQAVSDLVDDSIRPS